MAAFNTIVLVVVTLFGGLLALAGIIALLRGGGSEAHPDATQPDDD